MSIFLFAMNVLDVQHTNILSFNVYFFYCSPKKVNKAKTRVDNLIMQGEMQIR